MPGFVTRISFDPRIQTSWPAGVQALISSGGHLEVGVIPGRVDAPMRQSSTRLADDTAALWGHAFDTRDRKQLDAAELLRRFKRDGTDLLDNLEGGFHAVIHDSLRRQVHVFNDRAGMLPLYWRRTASGVTLAPRVRFVADEMPSFDPVGVLTFLGIGYCLHDRSLFDGVKVLTPATHMTVDLASRNVVSTTYWDIVYSPDNDASHRELASDLHEAVVDSVDLLNPHGNDRAGLFLSGGWDCRGILGAQLELGHPPAAVITNGKSDSIPGSDTALARRLAIDHGLEYRFCKRDPELAPRLYREGVARCELITDTAPEIFGQHRARPGVFDDLDFIFKGDEIWGWRTEAVDRLSAIAPVMPSKINSAALALLTPDFAENAAHLYQAEIDRVLSECRNDGWNDIKDYLYFKGRVARYIFGLGASDEEHLQVRRPFFTRKVLDVVRRVPARLRVEKNLYLEMMARHQSTLYRYRRNHVSHIADYYAYMTDEVVSVGQAIADGSACIPGMLRRAELADLLQSVVPGDTPSPKIDIRARLKDAFTDRWGHLWYRSGLYETRSRRLVADWSASDSVVRFRAFLLPVYCQSAPF